MHILMLAQFYPPTIGGEERHVQALSRALVTRGHSVAVATLWHEGMLDFEVDQGVRIYRVRGAAQHLAWLFKEPGRRHAAPAPDPALTMSLRRVVASERPQIVHAHNWLVHSFLPIKSWSGAKLVVTLHDYSLVCAQKRLMYRGELCSGPVTRKCLDCVAAYYGPLKGIPIVLSNWAMSIVERRAVDRFICVSRSVARGNGLPDSRLAHEVIPNFVPDDIASPQPASNTFLAQLPRGEYILFVGDLIRDKGVNVILRAYAELVNAPPLVLIGRPSAEMPAKLPPNVIVLYNWPHVAIMEAWRRCLLGLAPSTWREPFGTVVLEAMATGRPVIASRIGGMLDMIDDGESGLLVRPNDPNALRLAIARLLADAGLREHLGTVARRKVREFQASSVVPRIEQVYDALVQAAPACAAERSRNDHNKLLF
jgi:glycosyltransferase involved in cell wall biosynthesis